MLFDQVYVRHQGALTVRIYPPAAIAAGALWRRVGTPYWRTSGATESALPTGEYQIEFTPLPGWDHPITRGALIRNNQTNAMSAWYAQSDLNAVDARLWDLYE